jgi:small multidrug resistance family-3 protein
MSQVTTVGVLLLAAILEAGGDAIVRLGLYHSGLARTACFTVGGLVLLSYGLLVNTPPWEFGRLLGVYIVFFFVISQLVSWIAFQNVPSTSLLVGGAFIVAGGVILTVW